MSVSAFDNVLSSVLNKCYKLPRLKMSAEIKVGIYKFMATAVSAYSVVQNYHDDMFENGMVTLVMSVRHYSEVVLHGHEDISVTMTIKPAVGPGAPIVRRYRAILIGYTDPKAEGNIAGVNDATGSDNMSVVTFQLLTLAAYNLRLHEVGATYAKATAASVLISTLNGLQLNDEMAAVDAVSRINIDQEYSRRVFSTITLKDGVKLLELPDLLQEKYGIFQQGLCCFLQDGKWYIFAPYGIAKKFADIPKLKIFNASAAKNIGSERTMFIEGKTVTIVAAGNVTVVKNSDAEALNEGTGVRYADIKAIVGNTSTSAPGDDPRRTPTEYVTEYRASSYDGPYQNTVMATDRFSDNPLKYASALAKRSGRIVKIVWENGIINVLTPGMPVSFHYNRDNKVVIEHGTLLAAQSISQIANNGIVEVELITTVELTLFLKAG